MSDVQTTIEKTVIAANVVIKGELTLNGPALVAAQIQGTIHSSDLLEIAAEGNILGDVFGTLIDIQGTVRGNVTATEACRLGSNAQLVGELRSANLAISEGATFIGKVFVGTEAAMHQDETPATKPAAQPIAAPQPMAQPAAPAPSRLAPQTTSRVSTLEDEEELALADEANGSIHVNGAAAQAAMQRSKIIRAIR